MNSAATPRAIFDCNILFQAFLTPTGPAYECVRLVEARRVKLVTSVEILKEAREVLARPFVSERFPLVTTERIEAFLRGLAYTAELRRHVPRAIHYERDPDDEPYLNLAIEAAVDFLVTRDRDLLALTTAHSADARRLRQLTQNRLRITAPAEFLGAFSSGGPEDEQSAGAGQPR